MTAAESDQGKSHPTGTILVRNWQARRQQAEHREPQDAVEWLRSKGVTVAALTLIAIQLVWLAVLLSRSYFRQDDYFNFDRALANGLTWNYLMRVNAGHMAPLGFAMSWVLARVSLYNWALTCVLILALVAAACFALLRVLRTLFGNRPAILIPLGVYLFSPLALAAVTWWSVAAQSLPLELSIFMAVDAHVRYLRGGRFRSALAAAGWLLLGMATVEKGAVIPLLLFALTSAFFVEGRWTLAVVRAARRYWRAWLLYGVMVTGYCVVFFLRLPGSAIPPGAPDLASRVTSFLSALVGSTLVPGVLGGPWHWVLIGDGTAQASPPAALQQLSWAVALFIVVASCVYRVRAWRAWAILLVWIAGADVVPVVIGRIAVAPAGLLGLQARYVTDATSVLALCLGLAFLPLAGEQSVSRFQVSADTPAQTWRDIARSVRAATAVVLAIFLVGSFWSLQALEGISHTEAARSYIATARVAIAQAPHGAVIIDTPTPVMIMNPIFFGLRGSTSYVIGAMARDDPARHLSWITSPHGIVPGHLMIFDARGQLWPAGIAGPSSSPPPSGQRCWSVTTGGISVPLRASLFRWSWIVRLDYTGPATVLALRLGGKWAEATLPAGAHSFYVPLVGAGRELNVFLAGTPPAVLGSAASPAGITPAMCLTGVTVGTWQPAPPGPAFPAAPVPG
ncbi:MAG TPA: hypothetical protein VMV92_00155 [Streptosporangiaceae bacterium]|nr:hypothetical protein [Streptosporangiaceae bacterium]